MNITVKKINVFKILVDDLNSSKSINVTLDNARNQIIREYKIRPAVFDDERSRLSLRKFDYPVSNSAFKTQAKPVSFREKGIWMASNTCFRIRVPS